MTERLTERDNIENKRYIFNSEENAICVTNKKLDNCSTIAYCWGKPIDKLAQLEDIMEEYGIESVEELDKKLSNFDNFMKGNKFETIEDLQNALNGKFIEVFDEKNKIWQDMVKNLTKTEKDRDTWKRACELACEDKEIGIVKIINNTEIADLVRKNGDATLADYFYQQAKKEMER